MVPTELSEALAVRTEAEKTISRYTAKIARDLEYAKVRIALTHKGEYVVLLEGNWTGKVQHQALADYYKMRTCESTAANQLPPSS